jgi:hypothetical protein
MLAPAMTTARITDGGITFRLLVVVGRMYCLVDGGISYEVYSYTFPLR